MEYYISDNKLRLSLQQLEAVKQEHEDMRQQCQRVLANPYYQDELKNQIRKLDNQIATEQVIKGKLTYLNQMFKQVINHAHYHSYYRSITSRARGPTR